MLHTITTTVDTATTRYYQLLPLLTAQLHTIRYDTRCYYNVRSKADISQLNLLHGILYYYRLYYSLQHSYKQLCQTYSDGCVEWKNVSGVIGAKGQKQESAPIPLLPQDLRDWERTGPGRKCYAVE